MAEKTGTAVLVELKPLRWIASSKADLSAVPAEVPRHVGQAMYDAQLGDKHPDATVLKGFGDVGEIEVVTRHDGGTYRAVYTVRFIKAVYVLHVFWTKAKRGDGRKKQHIELIRERLKLAGADYADYARWSEITTGTRA